MESVAVKDIQMCQLEAMKKLHKICVDNDIRYTLIAGTLLGAVRHKGFIPWDDDIDIGLPRKDFDRLTQLLRESPIEGCFLQNYDTEAHYILPFTKLRIDGTSYIENYCRNVDMHMGLFIDIFPLDKIKQPGGILTELRRIAAKELSFTIMRKEGCIMPRKNLKRIEPPVSAVLGLLPKSFIIKCQDRLVIREDRDWDIRGDMFTTEYNTKTDYFLERELNDMILADFEDTQLFIPRNSDEILRRLYGDYMQLPPAEKRNSGHDIYRISL